MLYLERFFFPGALFPSANEGLFVGGDVIVVDVFHEFVLSVELQSALTPMAICFGEFGFPLTLTIAFLTFK